MTATTATKAPAFTYTPKAEPYDGFSMGSGRLVHAFRSVVIRSDGVKVWTGQSYREARSAQPQANMMAGRLRRYLAAHGACWHDRRQAVKDHAKARDAERRGVLRELGECVNEGVRAATAGQPEDSAPYAWDSAQGIVWTQAYRLTKDRLSDFDAANPEPVQP